MLYEEDYLAWTQQQIGLLQTGKLEELDLKNLVEELKEMERRDHRELESRLNTDRSKNSLGFPQLVGVPFEWPHQCLP